MGESSYRESAPATKGKVLHWPFIYDVGTWILSLGKERRFRQKTLDLADVRPGDSVLDIGCGTGTLALAAKRRTGPAGGVFGIDASRQMIRRAEKKARKAGAEVEFRAASAEALPFPDKTFDVVLSTLMLHHLPEDVRLTCLREALRVLKKGGRLLAVDFVATDRKKSFHGMFGRHESLNLDQLVRSLKETGFALIKTGEIGFLTLRYIRADK